ncbi:SUZ domain-containing protein 1-like isoform X1 [Lytechinus variegatus]|uniref:SUZ domain-containing protein 1-like isoform X1 n=1 Tax=Lytechinus variegatus TaxID=7654 RepID=UPI001BB25D49|nr:SUZ domain-containing protein 1-like isoform X1 [Lytechinus variegatus]
MDDSEEVWDSWEDMADSGVLDKKLQEAQKQRELATQEKKDVAPSVVLLEEESQRTTYQPQLRILKRPTEAGGDQNATENKDVNKTKQKTLAEREEEYKQARLRILGSAETDFSEASPRYVYCFLTLSRSPHSCYL